MTEREILAGTYFDKADIYRRADVPDPATNQMRPVVTRVAQGIACALSQSSSGKHMIRDGTGVTESSHLLFCTPDTDIRAGDRLEITTGAGQRYTLWAGAGFAYPSHAEIPLTGEQRS